MNRLILSLLFMSLLSFFSCKTQLQTAKPAEAYTAEKPIAKPSNLNIEMNVNLSSLAKSINKAFAKSVYEDSNIEDDDMKMKITKVQDIQFKSVGNVIQYTLPLKMNFTYRLKKEVLGVTIKDEYQATASVKVQGKTVYSIDKNWNFKTETVIDNFAWIEEPRVTIAGISLPITTIANITIRALQSKVTKEVDVALAENFNLKQTMQEVWSTLHSPIELNKDYEMWLRILPQQIYSTPIQGLGDKISCVFGLQAVMETSMGEKLTPVKTQTKLPLYYVSKTVPSQFSLHTNVSVTYSYINKFASTLLVGQEFAKGRKKIIVDSIAVYGQNNNIMVMVRVKGSVNGTIYCKGGLYYNPSTKTLEITDFGYDLETKNVMLKSANWLLQNNFIKLLQPMLSIPLQDMISQSLQEANKTLAHFEIQKGVMLQGKLTEVKLEKIYVLPTAIIINGSVLGKLALEIGDIM